MPEGAGRLALRRLPELMFLSLLLLLSACSGPEPKEEASALYERGSMHAMRAVELFEKGSEQQGEEENRKAIELLRRAVELDSTHRFAAGALAQALLLTNDYRASADWFRRALRQDPSVAVNHSGLGMALVNMGEFEEGTRSLQAGLALDSTSNHREFVGRKLTSMGLLALQYASGYEENGHQEQALHYRQFGLRVLQLAFSVEPNGNLGRTISGLAAAIGDSSTAIRYIDSAMAAE